MTISRRRFLSISAAFAAMPATAKARSWTGHAFGAEVSLTLHAPRDLAQAALEKTQSIIQEMEALFSLYRPDSLLSQLNAKGRISHPDPRFLALVEAADAANRLTQGLFDPTVQAIWKAKATAGEGADYAAADHKDWQHVHFDAESITLATGQALTFNGIAQGFATDAVVEALSALGLRDILVNIGEHRGLGKPWRLALQDPDFGPLGNITLVGDAIATSSPKATLLGTQGHILHPTASAHWSTVSVQARNATLADSLSTALVLAPLTQIEKILAQDQLKAKLSRIVLVDRNGDLISRDL